MFFRYGGYIHAAGEVDLEIEQETVLTEGGLPDYDRVTWTANGKLLGSGTEADLRGRIAALKLAYSLPGRDAALLHADGGLSAHVLLNANSLNGVRVLRANFPGGPAEYTTFRSYTIVLQAEYPYSGVRVTAFEESLAFSGGGPLVLHKTLVEGPPQKQQVAERTPFRCVQKGQAVGLNNYPPLPPPLWPRDLSQSPEVTRRRDRRGVNHVNCLLSWSYQFEAALPLLGEPFLWRGN